MILASAFDQIRFEVDAIVRKEFEAQIFALKSDDAIRLLKLRVWSERYKVSVHYIVCRLIPYYRKMAHNFRRRPDSKGIGVTIAVLTGKAAEEKLREFIAKDFPDGENVADWKESERARCIALADPEALVGKPKPFLHYTSIKSFLDSYTSRIGSLQREQTKLDKKMAKQPWRGNPWR